MDDLLTPMLYLAISPFSTNEDDIMRIDVRKLDTRILSDIEADAYWCLSKLLDNIHDHYTFSQPGINTCIYVYYLLLLSMHQYMGTYYIHIRI